MELPVSGSWARWLSSHCYLSALYIKELLFASLVCRLCKVPLWSGDHQCVELSTQLFGVVAYLCDLYCNILFKSISKLN